jgi:V/A-type H+-transporting ATPase subunit F
MKKIAIITPPDVTFGFRLTGAEHSVASNNDVLQQLQRILSEPDIGLVILDERLTQKIPLEELRKFEKKWHGILLVLPSPERREIEIEDYAMSLIRQAIGYHVRLKL